MHFIYYQREPLISQETRIPTEKKKYSRKKVQVTKQATSISDTNQYASNSDPWRQLPGNTFKHFGFFSLAKYEPISLGDRKEI